MVSLAPQGQFHWAAPTGGGVTWDQWTVLIFGVAGIALALTPSLAKYACFPGLAGQCGWFTAIQPDALPGVWLTCIAYCLAWTWGLWTHWIKPYLKAGSTPTVNPSIGPGSPKAPGTTTRPRLAVVPKR